ncbi:MAG: hypothetical protein GSR79_08820 [Desulfurococcales archaeon]|nr:hypothetical protein [Desulfurococcales archaeon]
MIISLILLEETRVDVYVSLSILVYFVSTSILPSIRENADLKYVDAFLITVFMVVVALRVAEVLGYKLPGGIR